MGASVTVQVLLGAVAPLASYLAHGVVLVFVDAVGGLRGSPISRASDARAHLARLREAPCGGGRFFFCTALREHGRTSRAESEPWSERAAWPRVGL